MKRSHSTRRGKQKSRNNCKHPGCLKPVSKPLGEALLRKKR